MSQKNQSKKKNDLPFDIPVEGSLGLLALGAVGLKAWREKRLAVQKSKGKRKDGN